MPTTTLYAGNLSLETTESELTRLFARYGDVERVTIIKNADIGRSRGFVQLNTDNAHIAIEELDGLELHGRFLFVNQARAEDCHTSRKPEV